MKRRDFFNNLCSSGGIILTPSVMAQATKRIAKKANDFTYE